MTGCVFSIEEFSVYDGPGIRTSVFLKGCPLKCSWCHNPEGQKREPQIVRSPNGCIGCGACTDNATCEKGELVFTEKSIRLCPRSLLRICGEEIESRDLCQRLMKNERILKNGGGITFSGGEPFVQSSFMLECLELLKGRLHTAIQTSGYTSEEAFKKALVLADYFLFDLKLADDELHKRYTGVSNELIHKNFRILAKSGRDFVVRIPLIPGVTDTESNIRGIAELMRENGVFYAELMPYNKMAGGKYKMVLREYTPDFDPTQEVKIQEDVFKEYAIETKVL